MTVTFTPGSTQQCYNIDILDDNIDEAEECFQLNVLDPTPSSTVVITRPTAMACIIDNDGEIMH